MFGHLRDAWNSVGAMEKSQAMLEYIQEVERHEPQWETKVTSDQGQRKLMNLTILPYYYNVNRLKTF